MDDWKLFTNENQSQAKSINWEEDFPDPPSWRSFNTQAEERKRRFIAPANAIEVVNAALYLRRPLLITGRPGTGKTSLAYAVAHELGLGEVLKWPITTRTTLEDGLYRYDAIARLRESQRDKKDEAPEDIGKFIQLGPLGTALIPSSPSKKPRILLIDEIDKSDIDLPNNLLNVFEDGEFDIPELIRIKEQTQDGVEVETYYRKQEEDRTYTVRQGQVKASTFPFVIMTSNGEREFPPAFLRRCLRLEMPNPDEEALKDIVKQHLGDETSENQEIRKKLIEEFLKYRDTQERNLATDQLLNAIYLLTQERNPTESEKEILLERIFQSLGDI
ncbi:MAG: MoxR family ATPase [Cyanobacteria bacterium P01_F01_bin.143]